MDKKGILTYLVVTFVVSYAIQAVTLFTHISGAFFYTVLLAPALGAWIALRVSAPDGPSIGKLWPVPKVTALRMAIAIPLVFTLVYVATSLLGFTRADWGLHELMARLPSADELQLPPEIAPALPKLILVAGLALNILLGPTVYAVMALANESGWRGYLLPRLMPLGRWPAYIITGLLWALSVLPFVAQSLGGLVALETLMTVPAMIVAGAVLGEVWNRSRHLGLTAVCCGCLACQVSSLWIYLFPASLTRFPLGGPLGVVSLVVWLLVALFPTVVFGRLEPKE